MKPQHEDPQDEDKRQTKKPYRAPHLEELGDLRTLTLGSSIGTGDSGVRTRRVRQTA